MKRARAMIYIALAYILNGFLISITVSIGLGIWENFPSSSWRGKCLRLSLSDCPSMPSFYRWMTIHYFSFTCWSLIMISFSLAQEPIYAQLILNNSFSFLQGSFYTPLRCGLSCGVFFHNHFEPIREDENVLSLLSDELSFSYNEFVPPLFHQMLDIEKKIEASYSNSSFTDRDEYETAKVSKLLSLVQNWTTSPVGSQKSLGKGVPNRLGPIPLILHVTDANTDTDKPDTIRPLKTRRNEGIKILIKKINKWSFKRDFFIEIYTKIGDTLHQHMNILFLESNGVGWNI